MVVQKAIDNLKGRPKEDKNAVATGFAVVVVSILLFAWGLWFVSNMKRGGEFDTFISSQQESLVPSYLKEADEVLRNSARRKEDSLRELRYTNVKEPANNSTDGATEEDVFSEPEGGL
jgi:hypothetical protein